MISSKVSIDSLLSDPRLGMKAFCFLFAIDGFDRLGLDRDPLATDCVLKVAVFDLDLPATDLVSYVFSSIALL